MTDRHYNCVYYEHNEGVDGHCLKHNKKIEKFYKPTCMNYIPRPGLLITYFLMGEKNWFNPSLWEKYSQIVTQFCKKKGWIGEN